MSESNVRGGSFSSGESDQPEAEEDAPGMKPEISVRGQDAAGLEDPGERLRVICLELPEAAEVPMKRRPTYGEANADLIVASPAHGKAASSGGH